MPFSTPNVLALMVSPGGQVIYLCPSQPWASAQLWSPGAQDSASSGRFRAASGGSPLNIVTRQC